MARLLAISMAFVVVSSALMTLIVFPRRRSFPANEWIVYEIDIQSSNGKHHNLYSREPDSSFGRNGIFLFDPDNQISNSSYAGADCSPNGQSLVFWDGNLYRFDIASSHLSQLLTGYGLNPQPAWSHDGSQIAYINSAQNEIFTLNADGSNHTRLTHNQAKETSVSWSPDDTRIAYIYSSRDNQKHLGIGIVEVASGAENAVYEAGANATDVVGVYNVTWSPDGAHLAFSISSGKRTDIYTIQPDGSALTRLTRDAQQNVLPRWSPDGSMISYSARDPGGQYQLYVMNADGSDPYPVFIGDKTDLYNRCWLVGTA